MSQTLTMIPVEKLRPRDNNLRADANGDDLIESIKTYGVLQPLNVTPDGEFYDINAGHRRYDAIVKAGLTEVPCVVTNGDAPTDEANVTAMMLVENLQRTDLDVVEQAKGFARLVALGWKQKDIAAKTGIHPSVISRRIKIADLPAEIQFGLKGGEISLDCAEALVDLAAIDPEMAVEYRFEPVWKIKNQTSYRAKEVALLKLEQKIQRMGDPVVFVPATLVQPRHGGIDRTKLFMLDGAECMYLQIEVPEELEPDEDGNVFTHDVLWTVGSGPLEVAAAMAEEGVAGVTVLQVKGEPAVVPVTLTTVRSAEEIAADEEAIARGEAPPDPEAVRKAEEKAKRARERAERQHHLEQLQLMVAGKLAKNDVTAAAEDTFVRIAHVESLKAAGRLLQLDPIERPHPWSTTKDGQPTIEKRYDLAFEEAWAEATGMNRTRMLFALVLAEVDQRINQYTPDDSPWLAVMQSFKDQLGYEEFAAE